MRNEPLHLAAQQQIGKHVAIGIGAVAVEPVGDGHRQFVAFSHRISIGIHQLAVQRHLLVRLQRRALFRHRHPQAQTVHVVIVHKHLALGQHLAFLSEEGENVHTRLQRCLVDDDADTLCRGHVKHIVIERGAARRHAQPEPHTFGQAVAGHAGAQGIFAGGEHVQHVAAPVGTGQTERVVATFIGDAEFQATHQLVLGLIALVAGHAKHTAAGIVGLEGAHLLSVAQEAAFNVQRASLGAPGLEGYTRGHAAHQVATLRIEVYLQLVVLVVEQRCGGLGQAGHAFLAILAVLYTVVDGKHAAEDAGVATQVFLETLTVEVLGQDARQAVPAMTVVVAALLHRRWYAGCEIQHPCRVGTHLVEAGVQRVFQQERAAGLTVSHHQLQRLNGKADRVHEFYIEDAAQVRCLQRSAVHHVCFEPNVLAFIIRGVVEMQIHALLRILPGKALEVLLSLCQQRVGGSISSRRPTCSKSTSRPQQAGCPYQKSG